MIAEQATTVYVELGSTKSASAPPRGGAREPSRNSSMFHLDRVVELLELTQRRRIVRCWGAVKSFHYGEIARKLFTREGLATLRNTTSPPMRPSHLRTTATNRNTPTFLTVNFIAQQPTSVRVACGTLEANIAAQHSTRTHAHTQHYSPPKPPHRTANPVHGNRTICASQAGSL